MLNKDINKVRAKEGIDWIHEALNLMVSNGLFFFLFLNLSIYALDYLLAQIVTPKYYLPVQALLLIVGYTIAIYITYCLDTYKSIDFFDIVDRLKERLPLLAPLLVSIVAIGFIAFYVMSDVLPTSHIIDWVLSSVPNIFGVAAGMLLSILYVLLFLLAILVVISIFIWLPIPLLLFHDVGIFEAVSLGLKAMFKNMGAFALSQFIFAIIVHICRLIPFAGFLIIPLFICLSYISYKRSFVR